MVYILSKDGKPLMPTERYGHIRKLLKSGRAVVVTRTPFTVKLAYKVENKTQPVTLGVDAGSKHIGVSASTEQKELFAAEVQPRNDVVKLLSDRREMRRNRRNRKTRYRAPRFNNRVKAKHKGWLAPSVEVKIQEHITTIKRVMKILPITKVIVETAEFDTQRLKAMLEGKPLPVGTDYQKGEQYDQYNVRQYVLWRDKYTCQCCGAHSTAKKSVKLVVHHLEEGRRTVGNSPDVQITLCEKCHKLFHAGLIELPDNKRHKGKPMRDAAFMGIMRKTLLARLRTELSVPVFETYGYITKYVREGAQLKKSHITDALCIANNPKAERCDMQYRVKAVRHHNRKLHKSTMLKGGIRKRNQAPYLVKGYRLWDKVKYNGQEWFISGRRTSGSFKLKDLCGTRSQDGVSYKKLMFLEPAQNYLKEVMART